jgi:hypothetical protein
MIDIETLDTNPRAEIVSIGIVVFTGVFILTKTMLHLQPQGRSISRDTVEFWLKQGKAPIKQNFFEGERVPLINALRYIRDTMEVNGVESVWANGAGFDLGILEDAYMQQGEPVPWRYGQICCIRALRHMRGDYSKFRRARSKKGEHVHNPVDDASIQVKYVQDTMRLLAAGKEANGREHTSIH